MEINEETKKIFKENNWNPETINYISAEFDENKEVKAIINYDKEMFILKNVWVREDFRGTGYTQDFLKRVFKEYTFMFVWEPNLAFIKAMVKAGLGLHEKVQKMDVWCLIPQMLSDVSNGFISRHDYLIKKNSHLYTMGMGPDKRILVSLLSEEFLAITKKEDYESVLKDGENITKKYPLIWDECSAELTLTVQEFSKDFTIYEKIAYNEKMEKSKLFMDKYLKKTIKQYEEIKEDMKFVDI
ncbi:hypothetical protein DSECCO2_494090 [anaerobic digester metagenome]